MADQKTDKTQLTTEVLLADAMLRIAAIEKLLIEKAVFTQDELTQATEEIAQRVAKVVMEKAQASKDLDDFVNKLQDKGKKTFEN